MKQIIKTYQGVFGVFLHLLYPRLSITLSHEMKLQRSAFSVFLFHSLLLGGSFHLLLLRIFNLENPVYYSIVVALIINYVLCIHNKKYVSLYEDDTYLTPLTHFLALFVIVLFL